MKLTDKMLLIRDGIKGAATGFLCPPYHRNTLRFNTI